MLIHLHSKPIKTILDTLHSLADSIWKSENIEIIGVYFTGNIVNVSLRTVDWNHSFMLKFKDDVVTIYHNNGLCVEIVGYKIVDGVNTNARIMNFVLKTIGRKGGMDCTSNISCDELYKKLLYDRTNNVANDIVDFIKEYDMHVNLYTTEGIITQDMNNRVTRASIYMLSSDCNINYRINLDKYSCELVENSLGNPFYSTGEFPIEEFAVRVPKFVKRKYSLRPVPVIAMDNNAISNTILAHFTSDSS
jgi:hypothetical protein